ncbi:MAG: transposase [Anaerolineae bacterium]
MTRQYDPDKHRRRSIRLRGWDYTSPGAYFVTICTYERQNLFDDDRFRDVAENAWRNIPTHDHAEHVVLDEWIVMPNHVHGILVLVEKDVRRGEAGRGEASGLEIPYTDEIITPLASPLQPPDAGEIIAPHASPLQPDIVVPDGLPFLADLDGGLEGPTGVEPGSVGAVVGNFKSLVTRRINNLRRTPGGKVWQRGYYDRIVRNERELEAIRQYIRDNPARWAEDRENLDALLSRMRLVT